MIHSSSFSVWHFDHFVGKEEIRFAWVCGVFRGLFALFLENKVREKSRECHNYKPQPFPDTKRKRKPTNPNKHKSNKRTKNTKISSLPQAR